VTDDDVGIEWAFESTPAIAGTNTTVRVTLANRSGRPLTGAKLQIEGHMSHPGMTPAVSALADRGNGRYDGTLGLNMAGDWTLVVAGTLADGRRLTRERLITVPAAR
jgi:hypothetical protein